MENKLIEFVKEFNAVADDVNQDIQLSYESTGYVEAISVEKVYLFDNDSSSEEYFKQTALTRLVKTAQDYLKIADEMLAEEVDRYFEIARNKLDEKWPDAKINISRKRDLLWSWYFVGKYPENDKELDEMVDVLVQDFEYIFDGAKLEVEY